MTQHIPEPAVQMHRGRAVLFPLILAAVPLILAPLVDANRSANVGDGRGHDP